MTVVTKQLFYTKKSNLPIYLCDSSYCSDSKDQKTFSKKKTFFFNGEALLQLLSLSLVTPLEFDLDIFKNKVWLLLLDRLWKVLNVTLNIFYLIH